MLTFGLLCAGAVLIWLGIHPFTTYPISLAILARLRPKPFCVAPFKGRVAICVCAYNEERAIKLKIEDMLALRRKLPELEILVYDDGSDDLTGELLQSFGDELIVVTSPVRHGKTYGMNLLVSSTQADVVVFSDANVLFAPDALPALLAPFADSDIGCVCGTLIYTTSEGGSTAFTGSAYWRLEEFIKGQESKTGSIMGADGSIFAIRRELHAQPPSDLIDDMYVSLSILCAGKRVVSVANALAFEEIVSNRAEEFRRKQRIACQAFNVHRALRASLRRLSLLNCYKYISHKLLRWMVIYQLSGGGLFLLAAICASHAWTAASMLVTIGLVTGALMLAWRPSVVAIVADVSIAFIATGLGVIRSLHGDRFQIWEPPASARQPLASSSTMTE